MEVAPNIFLVKLPLPFKLDHVNCYLCRGNNGWTIIDTGLNYPPSTIVWKKTFDNLGLKYSDITAIYVTHYHPDHFGSAGWLQELTGAPVYMHRNEDVFIEQMWKKGRVNIPVIGDLFKEHGMPPGLVDEVLDNLTGIWSVVQPYPVLSFISEGDRVEIGGRIFDIILTPGHSDGHICFLCREEGLLISGDHLLSKISSNISLWPASHPNPLESYLSSLKMIADLPVSKVLTAHGPEVNDCRGRVEELLEHHRDRLEQVSMLTGSGATAYSICTRLFGTDLNLHEIRFALTETLAHLACLESRGHVFSRQDAGIVIYRKVNQ
ncbi:MAG: MBL fold metallo-hydrolase [Bacillota bacterium]